MGRLKNRSVNNQLSTNRIETLSDGVFAIVITLLILEIRVLEIPEALIETQLLHKLLELWPKYLSYVTSFLVIGIYWVAHHNVFHYVKRSDRVLPWLNNFVFNVHLVYSFSYGCNWRVWTDTSCSSSLRRHFNHKCTSL